MKLVVFLCAFSISLKAQFPDTTLRDSHHEHEASIELRGQIVHPPGSSVGNLTVEPSDSLSQSHRVTTAVSSNRDFTFLSVVQGSYLLRVYSISGVMVSEKFTDVRDGFNSVEVELPKDDSARPGAGTVSIAQLLHRVPDKAMIEFNTGLKFLQKKDTDATIEHLETAGAIDPEFVEAQVDLGKLYLEKHELEKVLTAFDAVLKINPRSEVAYSGSSVA